VLLDDPAAAGRAGSLAIGGIAQVECGAAFNPGVALTTDANGKAILANLPSDIVIGTALETGASGERAAMAIGVAGGYISDPEKVVYEDFTTYDDSDRVSGCQADGTASDGTGDVLNLLFTKNHVYGHEAIVTQTITAPVMGDNGTTNHLDIAGDQTGNDGIEIYTHWIGASGRPFIVGNDAAFYFRCHFSIADVSGTDDFWIGFRNAAICQGTWDNYLDAAAMGHDAADGTVTIATIANNGATTDTDTTDTCLDVGSRAAGYIFKILVSAAGVCTFQHDIAAAGTLAAPTATFAFTLDDGDPVMPMVHLLQGTTTGHVGVMVWDVGYQ